MARKHARHSVKKHHSRKHAGRASHLKHKTRRHKKHYRGGSNCAAAAPGGAACNAGSAPNYAIAMVGDAFIQMKQALASAFS